MRLSVTMDPEQASSWDEYQRSLESKQNSILFSLLPGPLKTAVYGDLVAEIAHADDRRTNAEQRFEELKQQTRSLTSNLEDSLRACRHRGEPLPEEARNAVPDIRGTRAQIGGLLKEHTRFLTAAEQSTLRELEAELDEQVAYLQSKKQFDVGVAEVRDNLTSLETDADAACDGSSILSADAEEDLLKRITQTQQLLASLKPDSSETPLTESDLQTVGNIAEQLDSLQTQVEEYNSRYVSERYETVYRKAVRLYEDLQEELAASQEEGDPLPEPGPELLDRVDTIFQSITELRRPEAEAVLTSEQVENLDSVQSGLQDHRKFINSKHTFDSQINDIEAQVSDIELDVADPEERESYLTTLEKDALTSSIENITTAILSFDKQVALELLAERDQTRLKKLKRRVSRLEDRIENVNEQFVERKREQYADLFSGFGEENLALNSEQELAVYRNDIHNQVIAGAGTGKTFSLSCRVKYLVEEGVSEDDILTLTFTRKAADEMGERLDEMFDITGVETSTLHSFGNRTLNEVDPTLVQIEDQSRLREVSRFIRALRADDSDFESHYESFLEIYAEENLSDEPDTRKDFVESIQYSSGTTIRGEEVESRFDEEQDVHTSIADWLFKHQFDYRYRQYAAWAENPNNEAYIPDFTLPSLDLYIEYIPSDATRQRKRWYEQGPTADEIASIFEGTDKTCLVIDGNEVPPNQVTRYLADQLAARGIDSENPLRGAEFRDAVYEHNILTREIESHFADFVKKAKTNQQNPRDHLEALDRERDPELYHFTHAATQVLEVYNERYEEYNAYDFVDMIVMATSAIESGEAGEMARFKHVMVDEFQDLNLVQIEFIQALLTQHEDARLFAVGDDWQSIYGFKGARPDYFIDFEEHFPHDTKTELETNYRCPPSVVQAGNTLIQNNDAKTSKIVRANKSLETTPQVHLVPGSTEFQYKQNAVTRLVQLVTDSIRRNPDRDPSDIMVLARNEEGSPFIRDVSRELRKRDIEVGAGSGVEVTTAHQSKGKEAEHVIIANAAGDMSDGFPPTEGDRNLTALVEVNTGSHLDEERRLFYVALTRAEEQLDIQSRAGQQSPFIGEIQDHIAVDSAGPDWTADRTTVTVTVEDEREAEPYWETRQVGEVTINGKYSINFAIDDDATTQPLLDAGTEYRLEDVKIGEYNGQPQLQVDTETTVTS